MILTIQPAATGDMGRSQAILTCRRTRVATAPDDVPDIAYEPGRDGHDRRTVAKKHRRGDQHESDERGCLEL